MHSRRRQCFQRTTVGNIPPCPPPLLLSLHPPPLRFPLLIPFSSPLADPVQSPTGSSFPLSSFPFRSFVPSYLSADLPRHSFNHVALEYPLLVRPSHDLPFSISQWAAIFVSHVNFSHAPGARLRRYVCCFSAPGMHPGSVQS